MDISASDNKINSKISAVFSWSGGKDSAYALYKVLLEGIYEVRYLLSTFNGNFKRLSMHGVREELMDAQAASIGLPLLKVYVYESHNDEYERQMAATLAAAAKEGILHIIYGDIFLEDLRRYREETMRPLGLQCVFPLWKKNTKIMVNEFIDAGFKTVICCTNDAYLNEDWVGKTINKQFIQNLPPFTDACGENGEFHSFCFDGPIFKEAIPFTLGEKVYKPLDIAATDSPVKTLGFWYIDLLPVVETQAAIKACSQCGADFECKVNDIASCQCVGIQLTHAARQNLAAKYSGCLCKNCLSIPSSCEVP